MDSSDDDNIFITQNSFRVLDNSSEIDDNINDLLDVVNEDLSVTKYLDENENEDQFSDIDVDYLVKASQEAEDQNAMNQYSDISEDEEDSRFTFINDKEIELLTKKRYADQTEKKITWSLEVFRKWKRARNIKAIKHKDQEISPILVDLERMTKDELNYSLSRFAAEAKKTNGEKYPGKTIQEMILCIQFFLEKEGRSYKLLSGDDFMELRHTVDNLMKNNSKEALGIHVKKALEISAEEEEKLWSLDILGSNTPTKLFDTLFYLLGVHFALRGGQERRELRAGSNSQFSIETDSEQCRFLQYKQDTSKSNQGGLKHVKVKRKCVRAYENKSNVSRCVVALFEKYLSVCPIPRPQAFYLRPLNSKVSSWQDKKIWFSVQPMGRHALAKVVSFICQKAGMEGNYTNHSLRATSASRLYEQGVDEQLIQEQTGHRSLAVREYKRTSNTLKRKISAILNRDDENVASTSSVSDIKTMKMGNNSENLGEKGQFSFTFNIKM